MSRANKPPSDSQVLAKVEKEMAEPRVARSAKIAAQNLDKARHSDDSSTTIPGTVQEIIPSVASNQPEVAEIRMGEVGGPYVEFRIQNTLTDENGDDFKLKKGARVEVTVASHDLSLEK